MLPNSCKAIFFFVALQNYNCVFLIKTRDVMKVRKRLENVKTYTGKLW